MSMLGSRFLSRAWAATNAIPSSLFLLAVLIVLYPCLVASEAPAFLNSLAYDEGRLGDYPVQNFKSSKVQAPRINVARRDGACSSNLMTFLSPRGHAAPANNPQATILGQDGQLIWSSGWEKKQIYNLMAQQYKGADYLTFWAGDDTVGGHGAGDYYMLDQTYNLSRKISAANNLQGDLHDFRITSEGTAVMTIYEIVDHDLTSMGKTTGPIWDCIIQEVNLETGVLVFDWHAKDHLKISDTYRGIGSDGDPNGVPFDWFHINSIDKDYKGNYLVSSRYLHSVTYIDGKTGQVIWILGGKSNMFKDLSDGKAVSFAFQHDARWHNEYTEITLFDNSDDGPTSERSKPRGVRIKVDQKAMTAELVQEYVHPDHVGAASQGSMQDLPNGNVILGYGNTALFSEFSHDGRILCHSHFGPKKDFGSGNVQSYRVLKFEWHGYPATDPDLAIIQDDAQVWRAYVSWNGATEVVEWVLQGAHDASSVGKQWVALETKLKHGFETRFALEAGHPSHLRVVGLDAKGNILGVSKPADASVAHVTYTIERPLSSLSRCPGQMWTWGFGIVMGCGIMGLVLSARPVWRTCRSWRASRQRGHYRRVSNQETRAATGRLV